MNIRICGLSSAPIHRSSKGRFICRSQIMVFLQIRRVHWWIEYFGGDRYPWSLEPVGENTNDFAFYLKGRGNDYLSINGDGYYTTTQNPSTKFRLESPDRSFKTFDTDGKPPSPFPNRQWLQQMVEVKIASEKESLSWPSTTETTRTTESTTTSTTETTRTTASTTTSATETTRTTESTTIHV